MGAQAVRLSNVDIDNALKNKEFEVIFQPIFDLGNGALARVEAFVRWRHPALGLLPPGAFISFFESQGRMSELTRHVLGQALSQYLDWRGPSAPGFSINLALSDLADDAFALHFSVLLRDHTFPADLITLECPMPLVTMPVSVAAEHFARLATTGARLAIEVRGRANDFLRIIDPFPFDEIKTGGAAILRFARTVRGPGLSAISELIDIANNANAAITAVGVEDQASLAALRSLGFAAAQGNHLGRVGALSSFRPSRVNDVRELLELDPLSKDDLNALFRTEAPNLQQADADNAASGESGATPGSTESQNDPESLVERLETHLARRDAAKETETRAQQRRPKLAAAKAAAIARAKRKAAERASAGAEGVEENDEIQSDPKAARQLQERLAEEFSASTPAQEELRKPMAEPGRKTSEDGLDFDFVDDDIGAVGIDMEEIDAEETDASPVVEAAAGSLLDIAAEDETIFVESETVAGAGAAADHGFAGASLAIGRTGAHFRPGIRIGAAAPVAPPREFPATVEPEGPSAKEAPPAEENTAPGDLFIEPQEMIAAPETEGDQRPETIAEEASGFSKKDASLTIEEDVSVIAGSAGAVANARPRRSQRENFLTRRYRVWPTHFWPRSWKRAWRRRRPDSAQPASQQESTAAE